MVNNIKNNCTTPLKLTWDSVSNQYKVNKPDDQSGEYVDKSVANDLLLHLLHLKQICEEEIPEFNIPDLNKAIDNATNYLGTPIYSHLNCTIIPTIINKK